MEITSDENTFMEEDEQRQCVQTPYRHKLLYVVQRCWHSGPQHCVPVDMLRLFHSQREAEEVAYHSANAVASSTSSNSSVKTLLLPSYPAHNPRGSSYGFVTGGVLFWVRALHATIVTANHRGGIDTGIDMNTSAAATTCCNSAVYAILTEGVIGGTGNHDSSRGTEVCDGRVFGGDATACAIAMGAVARVQQQTGGNHKVGCETVPVGKPTQPASRWYSSGAFLGDWPWHHQVVDCVAAAPAMEDIGSTSAAAKRQFESGSDLGYYDCHQVLSRRTVSQEQDDDHATTFRYVNDNKEHFVVVDCPFEQPVAKRRCLVSSVSEDNNNPLVMHSTAAEDTNHTVFDYFGATTSTISIENHHHDDDNIMMQ